MLNIYLLGSFSLSIEQNVIKLPKSRERDLIVLAALQFPYGISRKSLAMRLWVDRNEQQAMSNLRKCLFKLKRSLPALQQFIDLDGDELTWNPDSEINIDIVGFRQCIAKASSGLDEESTQTFLQNAMNLYKGDFYPDCYDDWCLHERETLREQFIHTLERLSRLYEIKRAYSQALFCAQRLLHFDRLREETYRQVMQLQALLGRLTDVERTYRTCAEVLMKEFGTAPSIITDQLFERLARSETSVEFVEPTQIPLIGRAAEWRTLQECWTNTLRYGIRFVTIEGEFGIGKTRLVTELSETLRKRGYKVIKTSCDPLNQVSSFSPVMQWLRNEFMQEPIRRLDDSRRLTLGKLLPDLLSTPSHIHTIAAEQISPNMQRSQLNETLSHLFLSRDQPLLMIIENIQWCDDDTLSWLHSFPVFRSNAPILLLSTICTSFSIPQLLNTWRLTLRQQEILTEISLKPFSMRETQQFADAVSNTELSDVAIASAQRQSFGNPLLLLELLEENKVSTHEAKTQLRIRTLFELLLTQLAPEAIDLLQCAAVIGFQFTITQLITSGHFSSDTLFFLLDRLIQIGLLRLVDDECYCFASQSMHRIVLEAISIPKYTFWSRRLASFKY